VSYITSKDVATQVFFIAITEKMVEQKFKLACVSRVMILPRSKKISIKMESKSS